MTKTINENGVTLQMTKLEYVILGIIVKEGVEYAMNTDIWTEEGKKVIQNIKKTFSK